MNEEDEAITIDEAIARYTREFLAGKKRQLTITEYQNDLRSLFSEIPVMRVVDLALLHLDHYVSSHTPP